MGLGLVLALRLGYSLFFVPNAIDKTWRDGLSYDNIARNLVAGIGYWDTTGEWPGEPPYADPSAPTSFLPPGYPLFIAGVYRIFGESYRSVYVAQAAIGLGIAVFIYLLADCTVGKRQATWAVFLYAIDPFAIWTIGTFQTETLFTLLLIATVYCFIKMAEDRTIKLLLVILFGLLAGVGALTRSIGGLMFAGLSLGLLLGCEHRRIPVGRRLMILAVSSVVFLGTLLPWLIRNYELTGQYILSTQAWQSLAMGNNDNGGAYLSAAGLAAMPQTFIEQSEIEREAIYKKFVTDWIATHPARFAWLYLWRTVVFWSPLLNFAGRLGAILGGAFNGMVFLLAAIHIFASRNHWRKLFPIYMTFLTFTLGYSLAVVSTRYRLPLYPLLEILAAGGMLFLYERYQLGSTKLGFRRVRAQEE